MSSSLPHTLYQVRSAEVIETALTDRLHLFSGVAARTTAQNEHIQKLNLFLG